MYDGGKIIIGMLIVILFFTFPIWYNMASGKAAYKPELKYPANEKKCVADKLYMTDYHMDLLNDWRDKVVREGQRMMTAPNGKEYEMSLTKTCLQCHTEKTEFCDKCHNYLKVDPYCWDCHVVPKEEK